MVTGSPQMRNFSVIALVPAIFLESVFTRYQIGSVSVFSAGIVPPFFVSLPGAGLLKKGAIAPLLREKGGNCPLFDTEIYLPSFPSVLIW